MSDRPGIVAKLTPAALATLCQKCKGRGQVFDAEDEDWMDCQACNSTGCPAIPAAPQGADPVPGSGGGPTLPKAVHGPNWHVSTDDESDGSGSGSPHRGEPEIREARRYLEAILSKRADEDPTVQEFFAVADHSAETTFTPWAVRKALSALEAKPAERSGAMRPPGRLHEKTFL